MVAETAGRGTVGRWRTATAIETRASAPATIDAYDPTEPIGNRPMTKKTTAAKQQDAADDDHARLQFMGGRQTGRAGTATSAGAILASAAGEPWLAAGRGPSVYPARVVRVAVVGLRRRTGRNVAVGVTSTSAPTAPVGCWPRRRRRRLQPRRGGGVALGVPAG